MYIYFNRILNIIHRKIAKDRFVFKISDVIRQVLVCLLHCLSDKNTKKNNKKKKCTVCHKH